MAKKESAEYEIKLKDNLSNPLNRAKNSAGKFDDAMKKSEKSTSGFMSVFKGNVLSGAIMGAVSSMKSLAMESLTIGARFDAMEKSIKITSGTADEFQTNMGFIKDTTGRLGLDLESATKGFTLLTAATMGSSLEGDKSRKIFESVASATAQLGTSADDTKGIFLALGQMVSKGKVSAEELNGQLGERLPGALGIAAKAMGTTKAELMKMMQAGQLMSEDFLPKFAKALDEKFGDSSTKNVNTMTANMNRLRNVFTVTMAAIGQSMEPMISGLVVFAEWVKTNADVIIALSTTLLIGATAFGAYTLAMNAAAIGTKLVAVATWALNVAMNANPIGLVIIGITALVAVFVTLYKTNDKVRDTFNGIWASIKKVGSNIKTFVINTFKPFLEAWEAFKDGDYGKAAKAVGQGFLNVTPVGMAINSGVLVEGVGDAYKQEMKNREIQKQLGTGFVDKDKIRAGIGTGFQSSTAPITGATTIPGITPTTTTAKKKETSTSVSGVSSGRPTAINIDIGKLIENFNITSTNLEDMEIQVKNAVSRALVSAVNDVNLIAS